MASKETPRIHELNPQPTVAQAVAAAKRHVNVVQKAAQRSSGGK
jgi:hypothetical protein